jgi:hypothetical protein
VRDVEVWLPRDPLRHVTAATEVRLDRPDEQRVAREKRVAEGLSVLRVPELVAGADPPRGATLDAPQADPERKIEPHDRRPPLEYVAADARPVVPVDDPLIEPVERGRDATLELACRRRAPIRRWKRASSSTCVMTRRSAMVRLTVVLPEPGMPTT